MAHAPVLLKETLSFLDPKPGDCIVDGTVDGGGHAEEILKRIMPQGKFIGIDWDAALADAARVRFAEYTRARFIHGNYVNLPEILKGEGLRYADGLLLDLGFSSVQLEIAGRGFSFLKDEPLLMTYDNAAVPVRELLSGLGEDELTAILRRYGEESYARPIAHEIVLTRRKTKIRTTNDLVGAILRAVPAGARRRRVHPATRTFQALRIYANEELENLEGLLKKLPEVLADGGRVVILTFHSLEDRLVKQYFTRYAKEHIITLLTKKPVTPGRAEILRNPRSRSAKLRAARRNIFS